MRKKAATTTVSTDNSEQLASLQQELDTLKEQKQQIDNDKQKLEQEKTTNLEEIKNLKNQIKTNNDSIIRLQGEKGQLLGQQVLAQNLQQKQTESIKKIAELEAKITSNDADIAQKNEQIAQLQDALNKSGIDTTKLTTLTNEKNQLVQEKTQLETRNNELAVKITNLENTNKLILNKNQSLTTDNDNLTKNLNTANNKKVEFELQNQQLKVQIAAKEKDIEAINKKLSEADTKYKELEQQQDLTKQELAQVKLELEQAQKALAAKTLMPLNPTPIEQINTNDFVKNNDNLVRFLNNKDSFIDKNLLKQQLDAITNAKDDTEKEKALNAFKATLKTTDNRNTLVHLAIKNNDENALNNLLPFVDAELLNEEGSKGLTPLKLAIENNNQETLDILLKISDVDVNKDNLLYFAAENNKTEAIQSLLDRPDLKVNELSKKDLLDSQQSVLHKIVRENNIKALTYLLDKRSDADINIQDSNGDTALHVALDEKIIDKLIEKGTKIDVLNNKNNTPLHVAFSIFISDNRVKSLLKHKDIVKILSQKNKDGKTPLHLLATNIREYTLSTFKMFLETVKTVNNDQENIIKKIINSKDNDGNTPLHLLINNIVKKNKNSSDISKDYLAYVDLFIKESADKTEKNNKGKTPYNLFNKLDKNTALNKAYKSNFEEIRKLL